MNHIEFAVSRFENRNGVTSWRVSGLLAGVRIRKNFKTREEAAAEKATLEIKALQITAGQRAIITTLTEGQVREAEAVLHRLSGKKQSLSFLVDFALANYREPEKQKKLAEAIDNYVTAKEHEQAQDHISMPQCVRIRRDLKLLRDHFPNITVAELTVSTLIAFFERGNPALKTYNNRRGIVSTFMKYAFHRGWVTENVIAKVPHHRIRRKRGSAKTLTADQTRALMEQIELYQNGRWVPFFALCLFAGIRPSFPDGEITKLRPEDISLENGVISISADVSKVREPRKITIQPNLAAWLKAYPLKKDSIAVPNFHQRRAALSKEFGLSHDVMRHTFISMFVAKFRSMGEAALQAGNSESIIRRHYLDLKSTEEAEYFFAILPKHAVVPAVPVADKPTASAKTVLDVAA